jgi:hypothetical protein
MKYQKILKQMNKLMMAAVHGDGTLVLVGGAVLVASL